MPRGFLRELAELLDGLSRLAGAGLRWKDADLLLRAATPSRLRAHELPACRAAQRSAAGRSACRADCLMGPDWWRRRGHDALSRRCHRGILEQLAPVVEDDRLLGAIHVGPYRDARSPAHPGVAHLPAWDRDRAQAAARLAVQGVRLLSPARELALLGIGGDDDGTVAAAVHRIRSRARVDLALGPLAAELGRTPQGLSRALRRATGKAFAALREEAVIDRARRRLAAGAPVAEVAELLGYRQATHFSAAFRRAVGASPTAWRAALADERA